MIEIFASASIGAIVGFGVCAALTAGKVADAHYLTDEMLDATSRRAVDVALELVEAKEDRDRASDAAGALQSRIERALGCVTENSAHVGKRMAKILRGEA